MKKRIAIPVTNERLSEFFGKCSHCEIYEVEGKILNRQTVSFPPGIETSGLPEWLEKKGITDVIAHRVDPCIMNIFASKKVNLFVGVSLDVPAKLVEDYMQGILESDKQVIHELTHSTRE